MSSIKSSRRFLPRFLRRSSATSTTRSNASSGSEAGPRTGSTLRRSVSLSRLVAQSEVQPEVERLAPSTRSSSTRTTSANVSERKLSTACPQVTLEEPTPVAAPAVQAAEPAPAPSPASSSAGASSAVDPADLTATTSPSLVANADARVVRTLLDAPSPPASGYFGAAASSGTGSASRTGSGTDSGASHTGTSRTASRTGTPRTASRTASRAMAHRKIWVKRPGASATLVQIGEDDVVDDVRDMILRKYANSLGRSFDSPDVTLRIVPRDGHERTLGPEEDMGGALDACFPGGQTVHEALLIDVPVRRTPRPSPRVPLYYAHHDDAQHAQTEYFPPMPVGQPSPALAHAPHSMAVLSSGAALAHAPHSIAVLSNGQLPALPSPGGAATRRGHHSARPRIARTHTASPTTMAGGIPSSNTSTRLSRPRHDSSASADKHSPASNAPMPTPPAPVEPPAPPAVRVASPRPERKKKRKPALAEPPSLPAGLLDGSVPPINVLIVEDNIINLRVLGAFMQRLKVRWQRAMNGREAVTKWKAGGFHLVLMDIQLPVMNGLEATKEIRRLERVNSIGVFSSGSSEAPNTRHASDPELVADDRLGDRSLFKSPVIIVALTASSLQSDRHEALAAGCNDFLTKPVNFVWLERKVKEWGCMQALIDFDGWRKWKDFAKDSDSAKDKDTNKMSTSMASIAPARKPKPAAPQLAANPPDADKDDKKAKRKSLVHAPPAVPEDESETPTPDA